MDCSGGDRVLILDEAEARIGNSLLIILERCEPCCQREIAVLILQGLCILCPKHRVEIRT